MAEGDGRDWIAGGVVSTRDCSRLSVARTSKAGRLSGSQLRPVSTAAAKATRRQCIEKGRHAGPPGTIEMTMSLGQQGVGIVQYPRGKTGARASAKRSAELAAAHGQRRGEARIERAEGGEMGMGLQSAADEADGARAGGARRDAAAAVIAAVRSSVISSPSRIARGIRSHSR
jgi:hypothetical protein